MNLVKQYLGKVSITCNGKHDINKAYNRLCLVYIDVDDEIRSYISKKPVPKNIPLSNIDYWQPFSVSTSGGGSQEEHDPYAVTDLNVRHYDDETADIPEAGTYLIGSRQNPNDVLIRLEDLDWPTILEESIPDITDIVSTDKLERLDLEFSQYDSGAELALVYYKGSTRIVINTVNIALVDGTKAGLMSSDDKDKLDNLSVDMPKATSSELGGVKINGDGISIDNSGTIGLNIQAEGIASSDGYSLSLQDKDTTEELLELNIPLCDTDDAGLMSPSDKQHLTALNFRIEYQCPDSYITVVANNDVSIDSGNKVMTATVSFTNYTYTTYSAFVNDVAGGEFIGIKLNLDAPFLQLGIQGPRRYAGYFAMYGISSNPKFMLVEPSIIKGNPIFAEFVVNSSLEITGIMITGL